MPSELVEQSATALLWSGAWVLAAAGIAKIRSPRPTAVNLYTLTGRPWSVAGRRVELGAATALGAAELLIGLVTVVFDTPAGPAVASLAYFGFAVVSARLLAASPATGCGCFGANETRVSRRHVVINCGLGVVMASGIWVSPSLRVLVEAHQWPTKAVVLALSGVLAYVWVALLLGRGPTSSAGPRPNEHASQL